MSQPHQHDDPSGEARQQLLQGLAVLATVGEAGARWAAVGLQNKATQAEQDTQRGEAARAAQRQANLLAAQLRSERQRIAASVDGDWLTTKASFGEAAAAWRAAAVHAAAGDPVAATVAGLAQDRIRQIHPPFMDAYDRHRAAGRSTAEAMRAAAHEVWQAETRNPRAGARPHGNTRPLPELTDQAQKALPPGGRNVLNDLDAGVRAEAARLAEHVSPEALDRLQRILREAGQTPAADATGLLRQYATAAVVDGALPPAAAEAIARDLDRHAAAEHRQATVSAGTPDNPRTGIDEHTVGQMASGVWRGSADHDLAGAAQRRRMGQTFGPLTVGTLAPRLAGKRPAQVVDSARLRRAR
jgi:hypothetical protein